MFDDEPLMSAQLETIQADESDELTPFKAWMIRINWQSGQVSLYSHSSILTERRDEPFQLP